MTTVIQLVGVPILLHAWGAELYGKWLILFAIPAYLSMTDFGFSQSAGNDMTARNARGDRAGALVVFQNLATLVYTCAGICLALTTVSLWILPLVGWTGFVGLDIDTTCLMLWLLTAEVLVGVINGVAQAGFRANGDYPLYVGLSGSIRLLQFAGVWAAALSGGGLVGAALAFCGIRAVSAPLLTLFLLYRHPWLHFCFAINAVAQMRALFRPAFASMVIPLAQALNIQGMVLAIGWILGPLAVVAFSTLRTLTRLTLQTITAVSHAAEPELAAAYGAGDRVLMSTLFIHALRAALWFGLAAAIMLMTFGRFILAFWTHGSIPLNGPLFAWLLSSAIGSVLWYVALIVLRAANQHLRASLLLALASASTVVLGSVAVWWTDDVVSAGIALFLMDIVMAFYTLNAASRMLGIGPCRSVLRAVNPYPLLGLVMTRPFRS